ncbi:MAG TPA: [LysW]-aminoadipate kinase [Thermoplasmata archaeon]|nr:[LysW]-aminoadipate kinase [Thermoplasmata archaeon]
MGTTTIVVKVGGAAGNASGAVLADLAGRTDYVLVHGGSEEIDRLGVALGRPPVHYTSPSGVVSRRCDPGQLETVILALAGKVQTELVAGLGARGARAVGLSGVDGRLVLARRKTGARAVVDGRVIRLADDLAGTVEHVDAPLLRALLDLGVAPVVGPPAVTSDGLIVNVDADAVASAVAAALGAEALVLLTNVAGLLRSPKDPTSVVPRVERDAFDAALALAGGRMRKKLFAARDALAAGVGRVVIAPSRVDGPVRRALAGEGTVFA